MYFSGIADEAGADIDTQIRATRALGWQWIEGRAVEVSGFPRGNLHDIPDAAFDLVAGRLQDAGVRINCFGSAIMNWAKTVATPFEVTLDEVARAIPRMQRLGARLVRIMSFKPADDDEVIPPVVFERVREVTKRFLGAGLQPVHENCMNYGGMSPAHALQLLEKVPGLRWVFDTANPVFNPDRVKPKPWPRQDPWEFWVAVREATAHLHVKDATWDPARNDAGYNWPGEGEGRVREILTDALARGYDAGISIEPHLAVVFHDASVKASEEEQFNSYVEYGRRLERLVHEIQAGLAARQKRQG
jgi:sugar phosphate isomerase/epimerase